MEKKSLPNPYKYLVLFLLIAVLLVLLDAITVFRPIYKYSSYVFGPINQGINSSVQFVENTAQLIPKIKTLKSENETLKKEITDLRSENVDLAEQADKAAYILEQNKFIDNKVKYKLQSANVVAIEKTPLEIFLIINAGSRDLVQEDQTVIYQNFLIGKIDEVFEKTSRVAVVGSTNNSVPVITQKTGINAVLVSNLEDGVHISNILPGEIPEKGENVLSSSLGNQYEYGYLVGKVGKVLSTESEAVQRYGIERIIEYKDLKYVSIIVK